MGHGARSHWPWVSLALAHVLVISCGGDGTGPGSGGGPPRSLALGDTVRASTSPTTGRVLFHVTIPTDTVVALLGHGIIGSQAATLRVLGAPQILGAGTFPTEPVATGLESFVRVGPVSVAGGTVLEIDVSTQVGPASSEFRMVLLAVNPGPEQTARNLAAGDTLAGESFQSVADIDTYDLQGTPGATMVLLLDFGEYFEVNIKGATIGYDLYGRFSPDSQPDALLRRRSEHFVIPPSGKVVVEVRPRWGPLAGPYRIWAYPVNRGPEHRAAIVALGDTIRGEGLENIADIDEFKVPLPGPTEFILYAGNTGPTLGQPLVLTSLGAGASPARVDLKPDSARLDERNSGRLLATGDTLTLRIQADVYGTARPGAVAGIPYAVQARVINRAPEAVAALLVPGDTLVGEGTDYAGDLDEYRLPVQAGQRFALFIQASGGAAGAFATLDVLQDSVQLGQRALSFPGDSALAGQWTGTFTSSVTDTLLVRVDGWGPAPLAYRLFPYLIDTLPEHGPMLVQQGDTVNEAIEFQGDEDHFILAGPAAPDVLTVFLDRPGPPGGWLSVGSPLGSAVCYQDVSQSVVGCGTGRLYPPPDTLALTVGTGGYRGSYRLFSFPSDAGVEQGGSTIAVGAPVTTVLEVPGDIDSYDFVYQRGQLLNFQVGVTGMVAHVTDSIGSVFNVVAYHLVPSGRFELPKSGRYELRSYLYYADSVGNVGSGTLTLDSVPRNPEQAGPVLVPDAPLVAEAIDYLGDVDEFTVTAVPGTELVALNPMLFYGGPVASVFVPGDSIPLRVGGIESSGRWVVPPGGEVVVRMAEPRRHDLPAPETVFQGIGQYQLQVRTVARAPEARAAVVAVGDTIAGEAIDFIGDVDEYTFSAGAGQVVNLGIWALALTSLSEVVVELYDPSGTILLGTARTNDSTLEVTGSITLAAAGTYLIRVQCDTDIAGSGGYRVTFEP